MAGSAGLMGKIRSCLLGAALGLLLAMPPGLPASAHAAHMIPLVQDPRLEQNISDYLAELDGEYGVAVINLTDGRSAFVNSDTRFPAASMYKLLVMYRVYEALEGGDLAMDDELVIRAGDTVQDEPGGWYSPGEVTTVEQALDVMIRESSNAASFALTRAVGGWGMVESVAWDLGMEDTYMAGDEFWTTPNDMAHFFRLLASWKMVSPAASWEMIRLLLGQTRNDRLPSLLPEGVSVAHKTGELDDVQNDGGIVFAPGGWYVIVILSQLGSPDEQTWAEARLSYMVYGEYGS